VDGRDRTRQMSVGKQKGKRTDRRAGGMSEARIGQTSGRKGRKE
jgi:hypothetical protein